MVVNQSPFIASTITLCFLFSTMYGMALLFYEGQQQQLGTTPEISAFAEGKDPADIQNPSVSTGLLGVLIGFTDGLLEAASLFSPFGLIKAFLVLVGINTATPEIAVILNLFVFRPLGWASSLILVNYLISRIPTEHGE